MIRYSKNQKIIISIARIIIVSSFFVLWEYGAQSGFLDPFFFSSPAAIALDLKKLFITGKIYPHILMTLKEVFIGLGLGIVTGVLSGVVLGKYEILARIMDPVIMALYAIPKIAIAPLFILWFGLGIIGKIVFAWVVVFFLVFFNTYAGMKNVD